MTTLAAQHLAFGYRSQRPLFQELNLNLKSGQINCILGPNGVGKSTLLNCLTGVYQPTSGQVLLDDVDLHQIAAQKRAKKIAYVPQMSTDRTMVNFSLRDYVLLGRAPYLKLLTTPSAADYAKADAALAKLGIAELGDQPYPAVSGGQQQLASIARALLQEPALIIFDEPTSALDVANQVRVLHLIQQLATTGYGILLTTHDPNQALLLNAVVSTLDKAGHFQTGSTTEILTNETLSAVYQLPLRVVTIPETNQRTCVVDQQQIEN
ncbi:ABC transporter ATP-binding protein [Loigolactobacillus backii]|uniref:ABC transporter ATP-binding protein n=1 Tax=Loigolactobacillus backii TaxID=375175 RepID=UPI0007F1255B|nr:ABC transporter ATP-binding protein [Loigolactobacillus backii]ANK60438.1 iron ABC transporter ATP-binding protein [Loigolactobacillus backii]ANK65317.1 iron ABC transporter ATP-binding protein [Loigolactobacillus backii]MDA5389271.1 ABC transporter ATP-binding protein [Loigolactobacillus backii]